MTWNQWALVVWADIVLTKLVHNVQCPLCTRCSRRYNYCIHKNILFSHAVVLAQVVKALAYWEWLCFGMSRQFETTSAFFFVYLSSCFWNQNVKIVRSVDVASAKINRCSSQYKYLIHKILATASCSSLYKYKHLRLCCLHSAIDQSAARTQSGYFLS